MCVRLNEGMTGKVILDEYADREPDYWITDMAPNGTFVKVAEVVNIDLQTRVSLSMLRRKAQIPLRRLCDKVRGLS